MGSTTFYLKYRPQRISELDAEDIRLGLGKILKSKNLPHAFLFAGPRGIGKTSAARIVAKAVNCLDAQKFSVGEPCNRCQSCQEIAQGNSLDLIEIDAASNRGVEDIRDLREKIKLSPIRSRFKVYIIDEVHMLTREAFNALLKTLEEPPPHAIFILCTTEPEKLPETIVSRCLVFRFRRAAQKEIIHALERAAAGEKLEAEKGVLEAIATAADGSFRDAHKILEQLALGGGKITMSETEKLLSRTRETGPEKLLSLLAVKNARDALREIDRIAGDGGDLGIYNQRILETLRLLLLKKVGVDLRESEEGNLPVSLLELPLEKKDLIKLIGLFAKAAQEIKLSVISQLPLELAVIDWCGDDCQSVAGGDSAAEPPAKKPSPPPESKDSGNHTFGLEEVKNKWEELLLGVRPMNHSVETLLRACRPLKVEGDNLVLEVFYHFHKERLETPKCRETVEQAIEEIWGKSFKLRCVLGKKNATPSLEVAQAENASSEKADYDIIKTAEQIFSL